MSIPASFLKTAHEISLALSIFCVRRNHIVCDNTLKMVINLYELLVEKLKFIKSMYKKRTNNIEKIILY